MRAVTIQKALQMEFLDMPMPTIQQPDEVLIKVRIAGITASDRRAWHGSVPGDTFPFIPGKNVAGEVASIGMRVLNFHPGDRVAVDPMFSCGTCKYCLTRRTNLCPSLSVMGIHRPGGMAEYLTVPASHLHALPQNWTWERAAMVEPFCSVVHLLERGSAKQGEKMLVIGAGTIGLMLLTAARFLGLETVIAGVLPSRLQRASEMGASLTVNINDPDFSKTLQDWTDGKGVDLIIDTVSLKDFLPKLLEAAAPGGRLVCSSFADLSQPLLPSVFVKKELQLLGARLYSNKFPQVISWFSAGDMQPERLVSHSFDASDASDAFRLIEENPADSRRVLLFFNSPH
ncbi:MAG: alcohol dehydrogenase catalytic domain-containing protein [Fretibacterium sp.]|nr:alcohol dehydrogenase catalytic domain-containing protein [Fretibacterium sp.]